MPAIVPARPAILLCALSVCVLAACESITGVDDLQVDPKFDPDAAQPTPINGYVAPEAGTSDVTSEGSTPMDSAKDDVATDTSKACEGNTFGGHCYFELTATHDWAGAKKACEDKGAHLVTLSSKEEQDFAATIGSDQRWIGLYRDDPVTDAMDPANFKWVTGEAKTYEHWHMTEPNDGPCVRMQADGEWYDRPCAATTDKPALKAICERD